MLLRKLDRTAVPELWVRTDSTCGKWCYLGQSVYHITHCAQCRHPGLVTVGKWRVREAGKGGHEVRETEGERGKAYL